MSLFDTIYFVFFLTTQENPDTIIEHLEIVLKEEKLMRVIKPENLYTLFYKADILNVARQKWADKDYYNFIGNKKRQHLFLCFFNCSATFTYKDGNKVYAPKNTLVYIPEEAEYVVEFSNCDTTMDFNCIAINFKLFDENDESFCFNNSIKTYSFKHLPNIIQSFNMIADNFLCAVRSPMKISGLFYILLSDLAMYNHTKKHILPKYNVISKGIGILENQSINDIKIDELAKICNVSPIYFRKLFKEYSGTTPIEYKLNSTIELAKQYLIYNEMAVNEVSDILGFSSCTYFCRLFKKKTGLTPTQYMKQKRDVEI